MDEPEDTRTRILAAALRLIAAGGKDAATTRAVSAAAGVQAPAIYRLFGDKDGLLDATAEYAMTEYVAAKSKKAPHPDPVEDLRLGWDEHVAFGLAQPDLYELTSDGPAAKAGEAVLRKKIRRLAEAGLLRVTEERASALMQSVGAGVIRRLIMAPVGERDTELCEHAREMVLDAILGTRKGAPSSLAGAATMLATGLADVEMLSAGEKLLLGELLARIALSSRTGRSRARPSRRASRPRRSS